MTMLHVIYSLICQKKPMCKSGVVVIKAVFVPISSAKNYSVIPVTLSLALHPSPSCFGFFWPYLDEKCGAWGGGH